MSIAAKCICGKYTYFCNGLGDCPSVDFSDILKDNQEKLQSDFLVKTKNIIYWIIPNSEPVMNGKITWSWEIEVLPYTPIGEYFRNQHHDFVFYSYQVWEDFDEAKAFAVIKVAELWKEYFEQISTNKSTNN